jgi:hypothetical protein
MARLSKRIQHKIQPSNQAPEKKKKPGRDYLLIAVIWLNLFILAMGWSEFDVLNRSMYIALAVSLMLIYTHKHSTFSEKVLVWIERISFISIAVSVAIFAFICYKQFIA